MILGALSGRIPCIPSGPALLPPRHPRRSPNPQAFWHDGPIIEFEISL
jgi:hypothetical protein